MADKLLILGSQQHAKVLVALVRECYSKDLVVVGYLDDDPHRQGTEVLGLPILGPFSAMEALMKEQQIRYIALGVSNRFMPERENLFASILALGGQVPTLIHERAYVSSFAQVGHGVVLNPGVVVNAHAVIGANSVVYSNSTIEHETVLAKNTYIGPGVNFSSNARVGKNTFIGAGAKIIPDIKIGKNVVIGAGSVIIHDIPDDVTVAGVPAKIINPRSKTHF